MYEGYATEKGEKKKEQEQEPRCRC